jgi:hypothetical protein
MSEWVALEGSEVVKGKEKNNALPNLYSARIAHGWTAH